MATDLKKSEEAKGLGNSGQGVSYDPATLMKIKSLELRAKVIVEGFMNGIHRSPYHGFSVEFTDYRQYSAGDDLRYLDWRLLARSDRYYIKRFEDETNLRCYMLVDLSKSMGFSTLQYTKADYARTAAATLSYFLSTQRDAAGLFTFDQGISDYLPARFRPGHLRRIMLMLERAVAGTSTDVSGTLENIAKLVKKRCMIVLISDLLAPIETLEKNLSYLRSRGHEVAVLRVLDPSEVNFEFRDSAMFFDAESGKNLYVDPQTVRQSYLDQFNEHQQSVEQACQKLGIDFHQFTTDTPVSDALAAFINSRSGRTQQVRRASNVGAASGNAGGGE